MHRIGEKRKNFRRYDSHGGINSFSEPPPQKRVCVRREASSLTLGDKIWVFMRYCSQKLKDFFRFSQPETKFAHSTITSSNPERMSSSSHVVSDGMSSEYLSKFSTTTPSTVAVTSTPRANDSPFHPLLDFPSPSPRLEEESSNNPKKRPPEIQVLRNKHAVEEELVYTRLLGPHMAPRVSAEQRGTVSSKSLFTPLLENIGPSQSRCSTAAAHPSSTVSVTCSHVASPNDKRNNHSLYSYKPSTHSVVSSTSPIMHKHECSTRLFSLPQVKRPPASRCNDIRTKQAPVSKPAAVPDIKPSYWTQWMEEFKQEYKHLQAERQVVEEVARSKLQLHRKQRAAMEDMRVTRLRDALAETHLEADNAATTQTWLLTTQQMERVTSAISRGSEQECLSERFRIQVTRGDLRTLTGLTWLNDEVINFYFNLISECCKKEEGLKVHIFNSFFYSKLSMSGYSGVRRWTKKVNLFEHDLILLPVHLGMHWCLAAIDFNAKQFIYYDSLLGTNRVCLERLRDYLKSESLDKRKGVMDLEGWTDHTPRNIPQQSNSSDCGVFTCMYARHKAKKLPFNFSQENMPEIRKHMIYEILEQELL